MLPFLACSQSIVEFCYFFHKKLFKKSRKTTEIRSLKCLKYENKAQVNIFHQKQLKAVAKLTWNVD